MTEVYAKLGTVSSGTLRPEDLIPTFCKTLDDLSETCPYETRLQELISDLLGRITKNETRPDYFESGEAGWDLEELKELLEEFAPPYCYFGTTEGDGAEFGYWIDWDAIREATEEPEGDRELVKVKAGECHDWVGREHPNAEYILEVNDHDNSTLLDLDYNEIWSVV